MSVGELRSLSGDLLGRGGIFREDVFIFASRARVRICLRGLFYYLCWKSFLNHYVIVMKKYFIPLVFGLLFAHSCAKKEVHVDVTPELDREEAVLRELKFLPIDKQESLRSMGDGGLNLVIVNVKFGRKSRDCYGFGICYVDWFPGFDDLFSYGTTTETLSTYLREDMETGEHYLELPLAEAPNPKFTAEDLSLKVDAPLELISNGEDSLGESMVLPASTYKFDSSVGENGGYKIVLQDTH